MCVAHGKRRVGLFPCKALGCARPEGHGPPCSPVVRERRTLPSSDVLSDERRELEALLRVLSQNGGVSVSRNAVSQNACLAGAERAWPVSQNVRSSPRWAAVVESASDVQRGQPAPSVEVAGGVLL
jgi:hypothetical protein